MFQEIDREFSGLSWILQLVGAYFGPVVVLGVLTSWLGATDTTIIDYAATCLASLAFSMIVSRLFPSAIMEGQWVWALPVGIELFCMVWALFSEGAGSVARMFYIGSGPVGGEESGWILALLTLPVWSCVCYSLTMWRSSVRRNLSGPGGPMTARL